MMQTQDDCLYKIYLKYKKGDTDISKEHREFFKRYEQKKRNGVTYMEYREFECLFKYDK